MFHCSLVSAEVYGYLLELFSSLYCFPSCLCTSKHGHQVQKPTCRYVTLPSSKQCSMKKGVLMHLRSGIMPSKLSHNCGSIKYLFLKLFTTKSRRLATPRKKPFENMGKEENVGNQHFLLYPQCFHANQNQISSFKLHLLCRLQMLSIW